MTWYIWFDKNRIAKDIDRGFVFSLSKRFCDCCFLLFVQPSGWKNAIFMAKHTTIGLKAQKHLAQAERKRRPEWSDTTLFSHCKGKSVEYSWFWQTKPPICPTETPFHRNKTASCFANSPFCFSKPTRLKINHLKKSKKVKKHNCQKTQSICWKKMKIWIQKRKTHLNPSVFVVLTDLLQTIIPLTQIIDY